MGQDKEKTLQFNFSGAWLPAMDPEKIGPDNFSVLQNLRYARGGGLEGVDGYSKVNASPLQDSAYSWIGYVCGGYDASYDYLADCDAFDNISDAWSSKQDLGTAKRKLSGVAIYPVMYMFGGNYYTDDYVYSQDNDMYSAVENTWTAKTDMPTPGRSSHATFAYSHYGYCFGGTYGTAANAELKDNDKYNSISDSWISMADISVWSSGRTNIKAAGINNKAYVFGGYDWPSELKDCDEYDPVTDTWTAKTDMPAPVRQRHAAFAVSDKVYSAFGVTGVSRIKDCDEYSPVSDTWASTTDGPSPSRDALSASAIGTKGYVYGGYDASHVIIQDCDEFDPSTVSWASKTDLPAPARWYSEAVTV